MTQVCIARAHWFFSSDLSGGRRFLCIYSVGFRVKLAKFFLILFDSSFLDNNSVQEILFTIVKGVLLCY